VTATVYSIFSIPLFSDWYAKMMDMSMSDIFWGQEIILVQD
jgi:hypothetical protein